MPIRKQQSKTNYSATQSGTVPIALQSEQAIIGTILRDPSAAELVCSELRPEDFYSTYTTSAYRAIQSLLDDSLEVNQVSVQERSGLPRSTVEGFLEESQGIGPSQVKTLISELQRIGSLRQIYNVCVNASSSVSNSAKVEEIMDSLEKGLYQNERTGGSEAKDAKDVMEKVVDDFLSRQRDGGGAQISTGLKALDRAIIGLRPGKLFVVAARPSMGKTALAGTIRRAVLAQGYGVIEFALEMSAEELGERELAFQSQINLRKILSAKDISQEDLEAVAKVRESLVSGRWAIDDHTYSIGGIRRRSRILAGRMARAGIKVGTIIVDYLQLTGGDGGEERERTIAAASRGCKVLAKELGCTVIALSQLNRSCEYREDRRPIMSDIRESGSVEQDADIIGFVYREHMYDNTFPAEESEFIIRKHRSGPTGTVRLRYNPKLCTFLDVPGLDVEQQTAAGNGEEAPASTGES